MRVTFYPDEDALYIGISEKEFSYGKDLDEFKHLNFSEDHEVIGVEFLSVSHGVDLSNIPEDLKAAIEPILAERDVKLFA